MIQNYNLHDIPLFYLNTLHLYNKVLFKMRILLILSIITIGFAQSGIFFSTKSIKCSDKHMHRLFRRIM